MDVYCDILLDVIHPLMVFCCHGTSLPIYYSIVMVFRSKTIRYFATFFNKHQHIYYNNYICTAVVLRSDSAYQSSSPSNQWNVAMIWEIPSPLSTKWTSLLQNCHDNEGNFDILLRLIENSFKTKCHLSLMIIINYLLLLFKVGTVKIIISNLNHLFNK